MELPITTHRPLILLAALTCLCSGAALAADPDPSSLYEITAEGSPNAVKVGEKGKALIEIRPKAGAHVSDQAPLRLELTGRSVKVDKEKLTLADSVGKKAAGQEYASPRFEVPFSGTAAGKGGVDAKLTFFICTEKVCARQQKTLVMPVDVR